MAVVTLTHFDLELAFTLSTYMFILIWLKTLTYLAVYEPTRYFIKMIMEIVSNIKTFMIILILAMVAYS